MPATDNAVGIASAGLLRKVVQTAKVIHLLERRSRRRTRSRPGGSSLGKRKLWSGQYA